MRHRRPSGRARHAQAGFHPDQLPGPGSLRPRRGAGQPHRRPDPGPYGHQQGAARDREPDPPAAVGQPDQAQRPQRVHTRLPQRQPGVVLRGLGRRGERRPGRAARAAPTCPRSCAADELRRRPGAPARSRSRAAATTTLAANRSPPRWLHSQTSAGAARRQRPGQRPAAQRAAGVVPAVGADQVDGPAGALAHRAVPAARRAGRRPRPAAPQTPRARAGCRRTPSAPASRPGRSPGRRTSSSRTSPPATAAGQLGRRPAGRTGTPPARPGPTGRAARSAASAGPGRRWRPGSRRGLEPRARTGPAMPVAGQPPSRSSAADGRLDHPAGARLMPAPAPRSTRCTSRRARVSRSAASRPGRSPTFSSPAASSAAQRGRGRAAGRESVRSGSPARPCRPSTGRSRCRSPPPDPHGRRVGDRARPRPAWASGATGSGRTCATRGARSRSATGGRVDPAEPAGQASTVAATSSPSWSGSARSTPSGSEPRSSGSSAASAVSASTSGAPGHRVDADGQVGGDRRPAPRRSAGSRGAGRARRRAAARRRSAARSAARGDTAARSVHGWSRSGPVAPARGCASASRRRPAARTRRGRRSGPRTP